MLPLLLPSRLSTPIECNILIVRLVQTTWLTQPPWRLGPRAIRSPVDGGGGQISSAIRARTGGPGSHAKNRNSIRKAHLD
jgi:hypothetical protein